MKTLFGLAALASASLLAAAASVAQTADSGQRISRIIVYGNDPCPRGTDQEIVVCARRPDNERYRIPEEFRDDDSPEGVSWAARAQQLEYVGRTGIQSCSPVGPAGFTGCWEEMMRQAREDRRVNPQGQPVP